MRYIPFDEFLAKEELAVDELNLSEAMSKHHQKGVFYGVQYAMWDKAENDFKHKVSALEGSLAIQYRDSLEEEFGRKPTNDQVNSAVYADPSLAKMKSKYTHARAQAIMYKTTFDAFKNHKDILCSIANTQRAEMNAELTVKKLASGGSEKSQSIAENLKKLSKGASANN